MHPALAAGFREAPRTREVGTVSESGPPPGVHVTYRQRFNRCSKADCPACRGGGTGHGPYWYAYWREGGRVRSRYLGKQPPPEAAQTTTVALEVAAPSLRVRTLGGFEVWRHGTPLPATTWSRRKPTMLFKMLLSAPGHRLHRDQVIAGLWPDTAPAQAAGSLRTTLALLRAILDSPSDPSCVHMLGEILVLEPPAGGQWLDARAFAVAATVASAEQDPAVCRTALALYGGDYLPDDLYRDWASGLREDLRRHYLALLQHLAILYEAEGDRAGAIQTLQQVLAADPAREPAARSLMRLHAAAGQRTEAIRVFRRLAGVLASELAVQPEAETHALYEELIGVTSVHAATRPVPQRARAPIQPPVQPLQSGTEALALLGREEEMRYLERRLQQARMGNGGLILLQGSAGVGKSRLLTESLRLARDHGTLVLFGRARIGEGFVPYGPLRKALGDYMAMQHPAVLAEQCGAGGAALLTIWPDMAEILPEPAPAAALEPGVARIRLYAAVSALLQAMSQSLPVALALEDLHLADTSTLECLRYLQRSCRELPVLLLGSYRQEEVVPGTPLADLAADLQEERPEHLLAIEPLPDAAIAALVSLVLESESPDEGAIAWIVAKARGNALFARELAGALSPEDLIRIRERRWEREEEGSEPAPAGLRTLVRERLRRVDRDARLVLLVTALAGREATYALLHAVCDLDQDMLPEALDAAVRIGLLEETAVGYAFHHPLLAEVLYRESQAGARAILHRRVAEYLEANSANPARDSAATLAWHFGEARNHERAAHYALAAGNEALATQATREALAQFQAARNHLAAVSAESSQLSQIDEQIGDLQLELGDCEPAGQRYLLAREQETAPARLAELWRKEGDTWERRGRYDEALRAYEVAEHAGMVPTADQESAQYLLSEPRWAALILSRARVHERRGDYEAAAGAAASALTLLEGTPDSLDLALAHDLLGHAAYHRGRLADAERAYRQGLAIKERLGKPLHVARSWSSLANVQLLRGNFADADEQYGRAAAVFARIGDQASTAQSLMNRSIVAWNRGAYRETEDYAKQGLAIYERLGDRWGLAVCWLRFGHAARSRGDLAQAEECYRRSLALGMSGGIGRVLAESWRGLSAVAYERGAFREALRNARQARREAQRIGFSYELLFGMLGSARANLGLAKRLESQRCLDLAAIFLARAEALAEAASQVEARSRIALVRAELHLLRAERAEAIQAAQQALVLAATRRSRWEEAIAQRLLGYCALAGARYHEAVTHLRASWRLCRELQAEIEAARSAVALAEALRRASDASEGDREATVDEAESLDAAAAIVFAKRGASGEKEQLLSLIAGVRTEGAPPVSR